MTERARKLFEKALDEVIEAEKVGNMNFEEYNELSIECYGYGVNENDLYAHIAGFLCAKVWSIRNCLEGIKEEVE